LIVCHGDWYYPGEDGAMIKGLQAVDGKWYIMDESGKMLIKPLVLTPNQDSTLPFAGLSE